MGLSMCCCCSSSASQSNKELDEKLKIQTQRKSCISRMMVCFSTEYMLARLLGKDLKEEDIEE